MIIKRVDVTERSGKNIVIITYDIGYVHKIILDDDGLESFLRWYSDMYLGGLQ